MNLVAEICARRIIRRHCDLLENSTYSGWSPSGTYVIGDYKGYRAKFGCDLSGCHPFGTKGSRGQAKFQFVTAIRLQDSRSKGLYSSMPTAVGGYLLEQGWLISKISTHSNKAFQALQQIEKTFLPNVKADLGRILETVKSVECGQIAVDISVAKRTEKILKAFIWLGIIVIGVSVIYAVSW